MSNIIQFFGSSRPPTSIVNGSSDGSYAIGFDLSAASEYNLKEVATGALTADTLKTILTVSSSGVLNNLILGKIDATSRTIRLQVIVDGTTVFDATGSADTDETHTLLAVGNYNNTYGGAGGGRVPFNTSLVVKAASSLTETDKLVLLTAYEVN